MIFQDDIDFLKDFTNVILLRKGLAAVAVAPAYQGRVMTSTYEEETGPSFGWINRSGKQLISNSLVSKTG